MDITGWAAYDFLMDRYLKNGVIAGCVRLFAQNFLIHERNDDIVKSEVNNISRNRIPLKNSRN